MPGRELALTAYSGGRVETADERGIGALRPRTVLARGAVLLGLLAVVVAAVDLLVPGAGRRLGSADPAWLVVAVALEAGALVSYVAFFHCVFARPPNRLRLRRSAEIGRASCRERV